MMWIIAEVLVPYLLGAEKCYKLSNLIKDYSNTMLPKLTDRQTTLPKMVAYVWKKNESRFPGYLSNFMVNRDKTTLSIRRTLASYKGSIISIHNTIKCLHVRECV